MKQVSNTIRVLVPLRLSALLLITGRLFSGCLLLHCYNDWGGQGICLCRKSKKLGKQAHNISISLRGTVVSSSTKIHEMGDLPTSNGRCHLAICV